MRAVGCPHLHQSKRIFNDKKVSDHFAIIPTGRIAKLSDTEQRVYDMILSYGQGEVERP